MAWVVRGSLWNVSSGRWDRTQELAKLSVHCIFAYASLFITTPMSGRRLILRV